MKEPSTGGSPKVLPQFFLVLLGMFATWILVDHLAHLQLFGFRKRLPAIPAIPASASLPGADGAVGGMFLGVRDFAQRFPRQASVPVGTTISIDGSTSMVLINQALKTSFPSTYPGTVVNTAATGSDNGIQALLGGSGSLSRSQLQQIFRGEISNWSSVGGPDHPIRVLNRPSVSGTNKTFRELVLGGADFGKTANITTSDRDATTPLLRLLGSDGISYATFDQVADQQTARIVAINGSLPDAYSYPFQRPLFYVYRKPIDPAVKAFLGFALSADGQSRIHAGIKGT